MSTPSIRETDDTVNQLYPHEARLRNLTYAAPVFVSIKERQYQTAADKKFDMATDEVVMSRDIENHLLCYLPIMLKTDYCNLKRKNNDNIVQRGECVFDQGGYFVINGSEKASAS